jgi:hypothetical protein
MSCWLEIIKDYTSRYLSVPADNLLAISVIAQKFAGTLAYHLQDIDNVPEFSTYYNKPLLPSNAPYFAGIWFYQAENSFHRHWLSQQLFRSTMPRKFQYSGDKTLLKKRLNNSSPDLNKTYQGKPHREIHRSRDYLAPTWSWATIRDQIVFEDELDCLADGFEIISFDVKHEMQEAAYGAVKDGRLTVRGRMREIAQLTFIYQRGIVFKPDTEEDDEIFSKILRSKITGWMLAAFTSLGTGEKPKYPAWNPSSCKCLALVAEGTCYRRIGLCSIEEPDSGDHDTHFSVLGFSEPQIITII